MSSVPFTKFLVMHQWPALQEEMLSLRHEARSHNQPQPQPQEHGQCLLQAHAHNQHASNHKHRSHNPPSIRKRKHNQLLRRSAPVNQLVRQHLSQQHLRPRLRLYPPVHRKNPR